MDKVEAWLEKQAETPEIGYFYKLLALVRVYRKANHLAISTEPEGRKSIIPARALSLVANNARAAETKAEEIIGG